MHEHVIDMKFSSKWADYAIAFMVLLTINFALPRLLPGDPIEAIYGEEILRNMTPEMKTECMAKLGLDKPLLVQYVMYLRSLARFDLGQSYYHNDSVINVILEFLPWTLLLVGLGLVISTCLGFVLGVESAYRHGKLSDKVILGSIMFINGFPQFLVGILLLLCFSLSIDIFPSYGSVTPNSEYTGVAWVCDILWHIFLPLASIVIYETTTVYFLTRNTAITIVRRPFLLVGRAKGLRDWLLKFSYVGRNAAAPILTRTGVILGRMFTGALLVEVVFSYPGLGSLIYDSILARDYPVVQGTFFLIAITVFGLNLICESLVKMIYGRV